jgi:hypothetical protein
VAGDSQNGEKPWGGGKGPISRVGQGRISRRGASLKRCAIPGGGRVLSPHSPQMRPCVPQVRREFLEPQSIFSWLCSSEQKHRLAWHSTWEGVQLIFERVSNQHAPACFRLTFERANRQHAQPFLRPIFSRHAPALLRYILRTRRQEPVHPIVLAPPRSSRISLSLHASCLASYPTGHALSQFKEVELPIFPLPFVDPCLVSAPTGPLLIQGGCTRQPSSSLLLCSST